MTTSFERERDTPPLKFQNLSISPLYSLLYFLSLDLKVQCEVTIKGRGKGRPIYCTRNVLFRLLGLGRCQDPSLRLTTLGAGRPMNRRAVHDEWTAAFCNTRLFMRIVD